MRDLKATHRRLVVQIGEDLKEEVPKGILDGVEDHLAMTPQGGSTVIIDAPDPSMGALQSRLLERYGLTPPSSRLGRPGFSFPPGRAGPPGFGPGIGPPSRPDTSPKYVRAVSAREERTTEPSGRW